MPILKSGKNKGGLIAEQRPNREKPFGLLAQRTVGVLRDVNPVGIERAFNQTLSGVDGKHLKRKIAKGIWVPQDSEGNRLPRAGNNVVTTINTDMQDVAEKALESTLLHHDADWGCVVLMDVKTGEVKVIANLKKQKYEYSIAKFRLQKIEQEILLAAAQVHADLLLSQKKVDINRINVDLLERQVETDSDRLEKGEINLSDLAQSEASLAGAEAKLIAAQNNIVSSKANFEKIISKKFLHLFWSKKFPFCICKSIFFKIYCFISF